MSEHSVDNSVYIDGYFSRLTRAGKTPESDARQFLEKRDERGGRPAPVLGDGAAWKADTQETWPTPSDGTSVNRQARVGEQPPIAGVAPGPHRQGQTDRAGDGDWG